jgi:formamidopyrimidine-DNA glycosylase
MPELPEVEITRHCIAPFLEGNRVKDVVIRTTRLRFPVSSELAAELTGHTILKVERRAKYLLLRTASGSVILHLGMSGNLYTVPATTPPEKHDHLDIVLQSGKALRFTDPRRFGVALWTGEDPLNHPLLQGIGPEPLESGFDGDYLYMCSRGRSLSVKQFVMNSRMVAGVGNIYACESLYRAGINPLKKAGTISESGCLRLATAVREVLTEAITRGLRGLGDCGKDKGTHGYFSIDPEVYGREGDPCNRCGALIQNCRIVGRSTYFCTHCQK